MKKYVLFLLFALFVTSITMGQNVKLITYNIRYDNPGDKENPWDERKEVITSQITFYEPGVFGIQEGLSHQVEFLDSQLATYNYVGVGRDDGKTEGEYSAVYYHHNRFTEEDHGTFWLSETPEQPSVGWDAALERICTWVLLEHKESGKKLRVFNTHFDHRGELARANSARLILRKMEEISQPGEALVLMGDLNAVPDEEPIEVIDEKLKDARLASETEPFGPEGTYNRFNYEEPVKRRLDYIFVKDVEVVKYGVLNDPVNLHFPSDHFPVFAELRLK
ncbi:MAG: endonuclease/exonuclease/phosphatase family protein [Bacteroidales bacterium]|nr:endonuclease/exonuclease/phosphatase family protein [Bacteroidales bacterium]